MLKFQGSSTDSLDDFLEAIKSGQCPLQLPAYTRHLLGQVREFTIVAGSRRQVLKKLGELFYRHVHGKWSSAALLHPIDGIKVLLHSKDPATDLHLVDCAGVPKFEGIPAGQASMARFDRETEKPTSVLNGDLHRYQLTKGILENGFAAVVHVISNNRGIPPGLNLVMDILSDTQQVSKLLHDSSMYKVVVLNMIDKEIRYERETMDNTQLLDELRAIRESCSRRIAKYRERFKAWIDGGQHGESGDKAALLERLDASKMLESLCIDMTGTIADSAAQPWSDVEAEEFSQYRLETLIEQLQRAKSRTEEARLDQVMRSFPLLKESVASIGQSGSCLTTVSGHPQVYLPANSETQMAPFDRDVEKITSGLRDKYSKLSNADDVLKTIDNNWELERKRKFRADLVSGKTRLARLILPSQLVKNSIDDIATEIIRAAKSLLQGLPHVTESRRSFLLSILEHELFGNSARAQAIQEEAFQALRRPLKSIWEEGSRRPGRETINRHTAQLLAKNAPRLAETVVEVEIQQIKEYVVEIIEESVNAPELVEHQASTEPGLVDRFYRFLAEGFGEHKNTGNRWNWTPEFEEWQRMERLKRSPDNSESSKNGILDQMHLEPAPMAEMVLDRGLKRKAETDVVDLTGDD